MSNGTCLRTMRCSGGRRSSLLRKLSCAADQGSGTPANRSGHGAAASWNSRRPATSCRTHRSRAPQTRTHPFRWQRTTKQIDLASGNRSGTGSRVAGHVRNFNSSGPSDHAVHVCLWRTGGDAVQTQGRKCNGNADNGSQVRGSGWWVGIWVASRLDHGCAI